MRIIRVWKAPKNEHGARYVTVDEHGKLITHTKSWQTYGKHIR